jgi:hypothetical protein
VNHQQFHIFTKTGDARDELESLLRELGPEPAESKGFHKVMHVTRAAQTVVFLTGGATPLAAALRLRPGWVEPEQETKNA